MEQNPNDILPPNEANTNTNNTNQTPAETAPIAAGAQNMIQPPAAGYIYSPQPGAPQPQQPAGGYLPIPPQAPGYAIAQASPDIMPVWDYIWPQLLNLVPLGGIASLIIMFMWAFGNSYGPNRRNYARACLIIQLVAVIFIFILFFLFFGIFFTTIRNLG